jgi:Methylamine utilisation protein MauE
MERSSFESQGSVAAEALGLRFARVRLTFGMCTTLMLVLSWPLWLDCPEFPRVPFVRGIPAPQVWASWIGFGLLLSAVAASAVGLFWRPLLGIGLVFLVFLIVQDQHRFQPWVYQYLMTGLAFATVSRAKALGLARVFIVALYAHSGLSKLDVSFCRELGITFLETAVRPLGLEPAHWPTAVRTSVILAMPATELAIAVGLCFPKTRRVALAGAIALHVALLGILGVWGLGHSAIVLVWNMSLIVEDLLLFGSVAPTLVEVSEPSTRLGGLITWAFLTVVLMPFGERWGLWDSWPSFALYASHTERTDVLVHADDLDTLPRTLARHVLIEGSGPWRRLDLTGWSRAVRGVPVYPQCRAAIGIAEALGANNTGRHLIGVILWSRADRWTGRRSRSECWGLDAIRRQGDRYRLNAHPAPWHPSRVGSEPVKIP